MSTPEGVTFHKGRYIAQVSLGNDPVTGKRQRRQFTAPPCDDHEETVRSCRACKAVARDLRATKLAELATNTFVPSSDMTLGRWLDTWLDAHAGQVRELTLHHYRMKARAVIKPRIGHVPVQKVDTALLEGLYARLLAGDDLRPQGYAISSVRQTHAILHGALKAAVRPRGPYLLYNPASEAMLPQVDDSEDADDLEESFQTWTVKELRTFLTARRDHPEWVYFWLAAATGMRRSELCGLMWDAVDFGRNTIRVRLCRHRISKRDVWAKPKSKRSRRRIDLSPDQMAVLREHRKAQAELRLKAGAGWADNDLVFCAEDGSPLDPNHYTRTFERSLAGLSLPRIRLHDLRHTHATLLLEAGRPVKEVSERLGHSSTAFTMDVYAHVTEAMRTETAGVIDGMLGGL